MKLFKVTVEFETVIAAESREDAERDDDIKEAFADTHHDINRTAEEIKTREDLPHGWDKTCYPYGETESGTHTVEKYLP